MEGLLSFLLFAGVFYLMMRFGCGAHMTHGSHDHDDNASIEKQIDPVCGVLLEAEQGYGKMYEGSLYQFCSRECLDKFEAEPKKYLKGGVS